VLDGFGGLVVSVPEFAGSNPAEAVGFLRKIHSTPSYGGEVK
jgi:hypothetical protein